jgi:hypothetical protein
MTSTLPTGWEELGDLIASGDMTTEQCGLLIEQHGHSVHDCQDVCIQIWEAWEVRPLNLLLSHNLKKLTSEQASEVYDKLEVHMQPEDRGTRANMWSDRIALAVDAGLITKARFDLAEWLDCEYLEGTFSAEELRDTVKSYALELATFSDCELEDIEGFMENYHNPGDWSDGGYECEGAFEACEFCQEVVAEAKPLLKK